MEYTVMENIRWNETNLLTNIYDNIIYIYLYYLYVIARTGCKALHIKPCYLFSKFNS